MERLSNELLEETISAFTETIRPMKKDKENDELTAYTTLLIFLEELKSYRDAEEQGLLLRLPCKVGDTVYTLIPFCEICEEYLDEPEYCGEKKQCGSQVVSEMKFGIDNIYEVGKTVFLTKEEAEMKLAKLKEV